MDACGNTTSCQQTVTITDNNQPPVVICPSDQEQTTTTDNCQLNNIVLPDPIYHDNCQVTDLIWTITDPNGTDRTSPATGINIVNGQTFMVGRSKVTYIARDAAGNQSEPCSFYVTIKDLVKPAFTSGCPADVTQNADPNSCTAVVNVPVPAVSDPCNEGYTILNSFNNKDNASGTYPVGQSIVTWTIIMLQEM
jgi:hypothetical protein